MWVLEVIKTSERVLSETKCSGINEIGTSEVLKDLQYMRGPFIVNVGCGLMAKLLG